MARLIIDWLVNHGAVVIGVRCYKYPNARNFIMVAIVVDDHAFERMGAAAMFLDAGYRVLEANDADGALRLFEANPDIRLLFTDVSMPGSMSGSDLAHCVAERWPNVCVIITSGRPRPEPFAAGMFFHAKPYNPADVLRQAREIAPPHG
jgi:CheY-like chemotaxis protein